MKTFKFVMLVWHSWRAAWWASLVDQAERMRDFHQYSRAYLHRELFPPPPDNRSMSEIINDMERHAGN